MIASLKKRGQAVALTAVASLIAVAGVAANPAVAADAVGNINPDTKGTLTIHKFETPQNAWGFEANGATVTPPQGSNPIEGVTFKVYKVTGIDLTEGSNTWEKIKGLKYENGAFVCTAGEAKCSKDGLAKGAEMPAAANEGKTDAQGVVAFNELPVGLYLVEETDAPAKVTKKVSPFLVTIPFPNAAAATAENKGWLYDVHVYPKNDTTTFGKKVGDNTATIAKENGIGSDIEWVINATVPFGEDLKAFRISDTLDSKVKYYDGQDAAKAPKLTVGDEVLTSPADYTITPPTTAKGGKVVFEVTKDGLAKLNAKKGESVKLSFFTTVVDPLVDNKVVNDGAKIGLTNDPNNDFDVTPKTPDTPDPNNPVPTAYFGDYKLKKVSQVGAAPLKGAKFDVYRTTTAVATCAAATQDATLKIGSVESNEQGFVELNDFYRGAAEDSQKLYCLKETEAPAGFKLNNTVIDVNITKDSGKAADGDANFENVPTTTNDVPDLPLTGAAGKLLLTVGGAAILFFAVGTLFVTRRKNA